jgi:hypothetical protein
MRLHDVPVNQSVPTEANRGLTSYKKALLLFQRDKRASSPKAAPKAKRAHGAVGVQGSEEMGEVILPERPKLTKHEHQIKRPCKFE